MPTIVQLRSTRIDEEAGPNPLCLADQVSIYRAFSKDRGGHYLRVSINRNGKMYQKCFPERLCGGEQNTLKLAHAWRDTIIA